MSSAEKDKDGKEYLGDEPWSKMNMDTSKSSGMDYFNKMVSKVTGGLEGEDLLRVSWLSITLFFTVGGYWLLRSLKDPIMSVIDGVEYIPQAKIASLFVVFGLVIVYNKLLDIYPKHQLFYMMGTAYGVLFTVMGLLLMHPTIGLPNANPSPYRFLGWLSYVSIESFGSMVIQCYWALVNASVDMKFAKKNFGLIVAGAQIGSILGPTLATQANVLGIPFLYLVGSVIMFCMVGAMYLYVLRFGMKIDGVEADSGKAKQNDKDEGVMAGFNLFYYSDYVQGIFAISSLSMIQVTILDYTMKVLVKRQYEVEYPDDPQAAVRAFASFMGYFGQMTNTISFVFSLFGTGMVISKFGLTNTMISYPVLLFVCAALVWVYPTIWVVFTVMMVIKGMSYALNNPCKEILYQVTSTSVKFKCKSWIDTFGQRSSKAAGSLVTNAFATSLPDLVNYGSVTGVLISVGLIGISRFMGRDFEERSVSGIKVGDDNDESMGASFISVFIDSIMGKQPAATWKDSTSKEYMHIEMAKKEGENEEMEVPDTSCGLEEEGQAPPASEKSPTVNAGKFLV